MDTTIGSMTTQPTTTKEWEWTAWEACGGANEYLRDRVALLVDDEVLELYDDMRAALNDVFDECYPDPSPDNEEEYNDRHVEWLDWYESALWDEDCGNPGVVRLVREGGGYVLTARDTEGNQGNEQRMIHVAPALSDEEIREQVWKFLTEQDPLGKIEPLCAAEMGK